MPRSTAYMTFETELESILKSDGKIALPNVKEITDPAEGLRAIAGSRKLQDSPYHFLIRTFDPPLNGVQTREVTYYPKIFTNSAGMGSRFDGSGVILVGSHPKAKVFTFAFCEHEWDESGANHNRGWHPKRCTKCGFDASIDSGD